MNKKDVITITGARENNLKNINLSNVGNLGQKFQTTEHKIACLILSHKICRLMNAKIQFV